MSEPQSKGSSSQLDEARRLIASKSYAEAEVILQSIVAARPTDTSAWHELGNVHFRREAYAKSVEAFQRRYGLEPDDPIANYSLGVALIKLGRVDEARVYLKRAVDLKPDFTRAQQQLAGLNLPTGSQSNDSQQQPIKHKPHSPEAQQNLITSDPSLELFSKDLQRGKVTPGDILFERRPLFRIYLVWFAISGVLLMIARSSYAPRRSFRGPGLDLGGIGIISIFLALGLILYAIVSYRSTYYRIYQRRLDIDYGVIKHVADSIWLYEVTDVTYEQPFLLRLLGTAQIVLHTDKRKPYRIRGIAGSQEMRRLWETLRDASITQRRDLKGIWV